VLFTEGDSPAVRAELTFGRLPIIFKAIILIYFQSRDMPPKGQQQ
jgi:hypothetical protein